jgi:hypothetical protein
MSPQEVPAEVKSCKTIADDMERLRCFDSLFGSTPKPEKSEEGKQANWSIEETKSPTDGSLQVVAANLPHPCALAPRRIGAGCTRAPP